MPLLSIIVPIYKVERYLVECVESILNNEIKDIEIILVDDGSPDSCPKICDEYSAKYKNVITIHKENGGLVSARKAGISVARGEYITFVDGDDCICSSYYKQAFCNINNKPDVLILAINKELGNNQYVVWNSEFPSGLYEAEADIKEIARGVLFDERLKFKTLHSVCSMIVKTTIYKQIVDKVDDAVSVYEDAIFSLNCLAHASNVFIQNENSGYCYRYVSDSMTKAKEKDLFPARIVYSENLVRLKEIYPELLSGKVISDDLFRCGIKQMMEYYSSASLFKKICHNEKIKRLFLGENPISNEMRQHQEDNNQLSMKKRKLFKYYRGKYVEKK